ncbi:hypothetical protein BGX38DRAFT_1187361 [Terfezia claveryi]|nr:hypothetical protein BGX38DRAFT_1187361 [Terfezia claveryi]
MLDVNMSCPFADIRYLLVFSCYFADYLLMLQIWGFCLWLFTLIYMVGGVWLMVIYLAQKWGVRVGVWV